MSDDQPLFDIYFTGQLIDDTSIEAATSKLAQLFKTSPDKAATYFTGKPKALKRGVDKPTALKYKAALHQAGMMVAFKAHNSEAPPPKTPNQADKNTQTTLPKTSNAATGDFSLAPAGSDVLNDNEKTPFIEATVDTSNIKLVSAFLEPEVEVKDTPPAPDTSHISVAAAGEDLLEQSPEEVPELELNLENITLAPPGSDLEELHEDKPTVNPDISSISLAETGTDILSADEKQPPAPPAPSTDHISLNKNE